MDKESNLDPALMSPSSRFHLYLQKTWGLEPEGCQSHLISSCQPFTCSPGQLNPAQIPEHTFLVLKIQNVPEVVAPERKEMLKQNRLSIEIRT